MTASIFSVSVTMYGGDVAAVEHHTLDDLAVGLGGLGLLDGDDAVGADLLHGLGDQLADEFVTAGDGTDAGNVVRAVDLLGVGLDGGDSSLNGFGHALLHHDGVCTGGEVLQALTHHGLRQQRCGRGAVARDIVRLGGNFAHELRAHVLERIVELDLLGDGHAVVGDQRSAELLVENDVAALGAEGDLDGISKNVNTGLKRPCAPLRRT